MIITRSPLRISIGGGGTDLPSYYTLKGGQFISASINKYVYVTITKPFTPGIYLKYSKIENCNNVEDIKHPIIKECLKLFKIHKPQIEITTLADVPSGTGLGSSGSFTVALLKALFAFYGGYITKHELAELACDIEINRLNEPVGKQDQFVSAIGGVNIFNISKKGSVKYSPLDIPEHEMFRFEDNLLLFFTGDTRSASKILSHQNKKTQENDLIMIKNLDETKKLGNKIKEELLKFNFDNFGKLMNSHWENKIKRSPNMTNNRIKNIYTNALNNGAVGGKLVGAGGGGFLLFYSENPNKLRSFMNSTGVNELRFNFDFNGVKLITG